MLNRDEVIERYWVVDRTRPLVRANFIASLDGAATHDGQTEGLNNADDKLVFDTLRMLADVILVGAGTVRKEGYGGTLLSAEDAAWRVDNGLPEHPPLVVVSSRLDLSPEHPAFTDASTRPMVVTHDGSPRTLRTALAEVADVLVCGTDAVDLPAMIDALHARGHRQVLSEGGPHLLGALIEADCLDELCLTVSPVVEGGSAGRIAAGGAQTTRRMSLLHAFPAGDMLFLRYGRAGASAGSVE